MKKIFLIIYIITFSTILFACDNNGNDAVKKVNNNITTTDLLPRQLDTPTNVRVENQTVRWNSVPNAQYYIVSIDDLEYSATSLEYTMSFSDDKTYTIKVKAVGNGSTLTDSLYSDIYRYTYQNQIKETTDKFGNFSDVDRKTSMIGYGYNVLESGVLESGNVVWRSPIIDTTKILNATLLKVSTNSGKSGSIEASSASEFATDFSKKFAIGAGLELDKYVFTAGFDSKFEISSSITKEEKQNQFFYMYYHDASRFQLILQESNDSIRNMLNNTFESDLKSNMSAQELFNKYGTHLIIGVAMGARLEIYNSVYSTETLNEEELKRYFDTKISASMIGLGGVTGGTENERIVNEKLSSLTYKSTFKVHQVGGIEIPKITMKDIESNYSSWVSSIENSPVVCGLSSRESLIPLWDLLPEEELYKTRKDELIAYFIDKGFSKYDVFVSKYAKPSLVESVTFDRVNEVTPGETLTLKANIYPHDVTSYTQFFQTDSTYATLDQVTGELKIKQDAPEGTKIIVKVLVDSKYDEMEIEVVPKEDFINFSGGNGTPSNPYKITTIEQLKYIDEHSLVKHYQLMNDLDFINEVNWTPIQGEFKGVFNGNNYQIYNMKMHIAPTKYTSETSIGLFSKLGESGIIKNLKVRLVTTSDANHDSSDVYYGGIAGTNNGTIENSHVYGEVNLSRQQSAVGGLVGFNNGMIKNSSNHAIIRGNGDLGGITGLNNGTISESYNTAQVSYYYQTANRSIGGLVGYNKLGNVYDSYSTGIVMYYRPSTKGSSGTKIAPYIGGFIGRNDVDAVVERSYSVGNVDKGTLAKYEYSCGWFCTEDINQYKYVGGFIGRLDGTKVKDNFGLESTYSVSIGSSSASKSIWSSQNTTVTETILQNKTGELNDKNLEANPWNKLPEFFYPQLKSNFHHE